MPPGCRKSSQKEKLFLIQLQARTQLTEAKAKLEVTDRDLSELLLKESKFEAMEQIAADREERFEKRIKDDVAEMVSHMEV